MIFLTLYAKAKILLTYNIQFILNDSETEKAASDCETAFLLMITLRFIVLSSKSESFLLTVSPSKPLSSSSLRSSFNAYPITEPDDDLDEVYKLNKSQHHNNNIKYVS